MNINKYIFTGRVLYGLTIYRSNLDTNMPPRHTRDIDWSIRPEGCEFDLVHVTGVGEGKDKESL